MRFLAALLIAVIALPSFSQTKGDEGKRYNLFLTGASFASKDNTWFEMGCERLNATPVNRAVGGHAIAHTANMMAEGTMYTAEELDNMDAFVIMQVHNKDVYDPTQLKENIEEYALPFDLSNYAAAYDYVIKKYMIDCYNLKDNPKSKYYQTAYGKPPVIVLSTHWNDSRITYNKAIRQLADKWGLPLIEFDKYIGFSYKQNHPVTNLPISLTYASDTQVIEGTEHGFHPYRGQDKYIQQRMAAIFASLMNNILL